MDLNRSLQLKWCLNFILFPFPKIQQNNNLKIFSFCSPTVKKKKAIRQTEYQSLGREKL